MKKITWSVAALLIAGTTLFGQTSDDNKEKYDRAMKEFKALEYQIEDIVSAIRMDMYYGHLDTHRGNYYINEVMIIKHKQMRVMEDLWLKRNVTLSELQTKLN
jgi:replicative DNA helicase|tara:strand:+ start:810 stop:1118 length:309 start_codon:yes stop_codon:yes gene_type:complete